jgi:hypothetical protein
MYALISIDGFISGASTYNNQCTGFYIEDWDTFFKDNMIILLVSNERSELEHYKRVYIAPEHDTMIIEVNAYIDYDPVEY